MRHNPVWYVTGEYSTGSRPSGCQLAGDGVHSEGPRPKARQLDVPQLSYLLARGNGKRLGWQGEGPLGAVGRNHDAPLVHRAQVGGPKGQAHDGLAAGVPQGQIVDGHGGDGDGSRGRHHQDSCRAER